MKGVAERFGFGWTFAAAAGIIAFAAVFALEYLAFRQALVDEATHRLGARAAITAANLREALKTGDFRTLHSVAEECAEEGLRLVVLSGEKGVFFDSAPDFPHGREAVIGESRAGDFRLRLGEDLELVLSPLRRAWRGFLLAALLGAALVTLGFLALYRQRLRIGELQRLERFRREFIADVSHEIKTPLTGIMGAAEMLPSASDDATRRRLAELIAVAGGRLERLVGSILDLARLEREDSEVAREAVDLAAVSRAVIAEFAAEASKAGCALKAEFAVARPVVAGDARLLESAVANLVANAIRHSGSPEVRLAVRAAGAAVELTVEDHGVGIPAAVAERVFERFYRVDAARSADRGGSGLGLAIVRRIAELHGGSVRCVPTPSGGATFVLRLPKGE